MAFYIIIIMGFKGVHEKNSRTYIGRHDRMVPSDCPIQSWSRKVAEKKGKGVWGRRRRRRWRRRWGTHLSSPAMGLRHLRLPSILRISDFEYFIFRLFFFRISLYISLISSLSSLFLFFSLSLCLQLLKKCGWEEGTGLGVSQQVPLFFSPLIETADDVYFLILN